MNCDGCKARKESEICKGRTAVLGCAEGKARVIMNSNEYAEVEEKEIIITPMTEPDSIGAIHKSAGVITDRGGVLCHAAIVCREIGKPCIVGTSNATKVLRNGDNIKICTKYGKVYKID
ncbi:PEP-utilizing enzyme [[Clostridium] polysaccharolyticum]|jgi:pyruvate,water dikinase|uniref:PEP-utilising enzyme, mobile domain n=1 Tax=[Clostridium] polysaccharolyticum TaxID=29364 RepID=A0A1I0ARB5_9FIRM|nr:PEP-utilizing enzyme [[Clostridium] polysaccharolyticum]SES96932.1 PEP-utilising enzyme, mobile domain [[Clostridium] polysaccharolyticum]